MLIALPLIGLGMLLVSVVFLAWPA